MLKGNKKGIALFIVLTLLLVVIVLAGVVLNIMLIQFRLSHHQISRIQAYYAAQAGVNYALEKLRLGNDPDWPAVGSYTRFLCRSGCSGPGDINDSDLPAPIQQVEIIISNPGSGIAGTRPVSARATYTYTPS